MPEQVGQPGRIALYEKCLAGLPEDIFKDLLDYLIRGNGNEQHNTPRKLAVKLIEEPMLLHELIELIKILDKKDHDTLKTCFDGIHKRFGYGDLEKFYAGYWAQRNSNDYVELPHHKAKETTIRQLAPKLVGMKHICVITNPERKPIGVITQGDINRTADDSFDLLVIDYVQDQQVKYFEYETLMEIVNEYLDSNSRDDAIIVREEKFIGVVTKSEITEWRITRKSSSS